MIVGPAIRHLYLFISLSCLMIPAQAITASLRIRIFSDKSVTSLTLGAGNGSYSLKGGDASLGTVGSKSLVHLRLAGNKIQVEKNGKNLGAYNRVSLSGAAAKAYFKIRIQGEERWYEGRLEATARNGSLWLVNVVDLEHYVAGVVESEGGDGNNPEFYKVQCLISRTYAVKNRRKHEGEGYHLCDGVHCQLYLGRCRHQPIHEAMEATRSLVITDTGGRLISTPFHANSWGETVNSEDVWTYAEPSLRSRTDSFSLDMPKASWEKTIARSAWLAYLRDSFRYPVDDPRMLDSALNYTQDRRKLYFPGGVPLKKIRADQDLRSTFFSLSVAGDSIVFKGNGFGHGIGLSQEGALNMARQGHGFEDILEYYYRQVNIRRLTPGMMNGKR